MVLLSVGMMAMAQNGGQNSEQNPLVQDSEEQYYIYNFIYISGDIKNEGLKADIDDGKSIERVKDAEGKTIKFRTPAAVLMYFVADGWELYSNGATTSGSSVSGIGSVSSTSYWIIRKRCTKEEMLEAAKAGRKR